MTAAAQAQRNGFSLSPRGDGNVLLDGFNHQDRRFSLSPRGDGNRSTTSWTSSRVSIFFIPARGRKHVVVAFDVLAHLDFLYPREGTETAITQTRMIWAYDFLYPREGTETATACSAPPAPALIFFIPARGRKQRVDAVLIQ